MLGLPVFVLPPPNIDPVLGAFPVLAAPNKEGAGVPDAEAAEEVVPAPNVDDCPPVALPKGFVAAGVPPPRLPNKPAGAGFVVAADPKLNWEDVEGVAAPKRGLAVPGCALEPNILEVPLLFPLLPLPVAPPPPALPNENAMFRDRE